MQICSLPQVWTGRSPDGYHTAVGRILLTARAANAGSAHRSESHLSSQEPDEAPETGCLSAHSAPSWGAQPMAQEIRSTMTAEVFQSRWCHEEVLCSRPAEASRAATHMHWTAAHPVRSWIGIRTQMLSWSMYIPSFTLLNEGAHRQGTRASHQGTRARLFLWSRHPLGTLSISLSLMTTCSQWIWRRPYHHVDMHGSTWDYVGFSWLGQKVGIRSLRC